MAVNSFAGGYSKKKKKKEINIKHVAEGGIRCLKPQNVHK